MARAKSLLDCLSEVSKSTHARLPNSIKKAAKDGRRDLMEAGLKPYLNNLYKIKEEIQDQHIANQVGQEANTVSGSYVNNPHDETNELNKFNTTKLNKLQKNLVQMLGGITKAIASKFYRKNELDSADHKVIDDFTREFQSKAATVLERIFLPKEGTSFPHRSEDMIQYFVKRNENDIKKAEPIVEVIDVDGNTVTSFLDTPLKDAISSTLYEWLGTNAHRQAFLQDDYSIHNLLDLGKDQEVPKSAEILREAGTHTNTLATTLGKKILKRLSIEPGTEANALTQNRLEMSLGFMAISTLEDMGIVERQQIHMSALDRLKDGEIVTEKELFYKANYVNGKDINRSDNQRIMKLTRLLPKKNLETGNNVLDKNGDPIVPDWFTHIEDLMTEAPYAFDKLYRHDYEKQNYSFEPIKLPKNMRIGNSNTFATKEQRDNLQKYSDIEHIPTATFGVFTAMHDMVEANESDEELNQIFRAMLGEETLDGKLNARGEHVKGIRQDITNNLKAIKEWRRLSEAKGTQSFYIPNRFMSVMRMLQIGKISPQNSKIMRNLFSPKEWNVSFNPFTDKEINSEFLQAIALAFDIESGKVGGYQNQIEQMRDLTELNRIDNLKEKDQSKNIAINRALNVLENYLQASNPEMTKETLHVVSEAVQLIGTKTHALKGLIELARYNNHINNGSTEPFTTDIYKEIDGVSNGPIIGITQLISNDAIEKEESARELLAMLALGGISINNTELRDLDQLLADPWLNDAYQRMGQIWALEIEKLRGEIRGNYTQAKRPYRQALAIEMILGDFQDMETSPSEGKVKGKVRSLVRKLAKPRTMQTTYGAGGTKQAGLFAREALIDDGIYKHMESFLKLAESPLSDPVAQAKVISKFKNFIKMINLLTNDVVKDADGNWTTRTAEEINANQYIRNGKLNVTAIKNFYLTSKQQNQIVKASNATYGKAMNTAVEAIYKHIQNARKPFNNAAAASTTIYNQLLTTKYNNKSDEKIRNKIEELKTQHMFPDLTTVLEAELAEGKRNTETSKKFYVKFPEVTVTKGELDVILQEIAPLQPAIKTPLNGGLLGISEIKKHSEQLQEQAVAQTYAKEGLPIQRGNAEGIPLLAAPGVSAMVRAIQMIDSMIANKLMGSGIHILNNHDGFSHSIKDSARVRDVANERFHEIMINYSLGEAFADMMNNSYKTGVKAMEAAGVDYASMLKAMAQDGAMDEHQAAMELSMDPGDIIAEVQEYIDSGFETDWQKAKAQIISNLFTQAVKQNLIDPKSSVEAILRGINRDTTQMAEQTTKNKKILAENTVRSSQYPDKGLGIEIDSASTDIEVFGVPRNEVLNMDAKAAQGNVQELANILDQRNPADALARGSSQNSDVSTNPKDYPHGAEHINSQNVAENFERLADIDANASFGSIPLSAEHRSHLGRVLNEVVAKVMSPVQLFMKEHALDQETKGLYTINEETGGKIWLQTQKVSANPQPGMLGQGIRMSAAETYFHELVHHITLTGLKKSPYLKKQAYALWELARSEFQDLHGENAWRVFMSDRDADIDDPANAYEIQAAKDRWNYVFEPTEREDGGHAGVDEFLAFGLTNEHFKNELAYLTVPNKKKSTALFGIFEKNIQQSVMNLFNLIMDIVHENFLGQTHSRNVDQELENLVLAIGQVDRRAKTALFRHFAELSEKAMATSLKVDTKIKEKVSSAMETKAATRIISNLEQIPDWDNMVSHKMRQVMNKANDEQQGIVPTLVAEMKGATVRLQKLHGLLGVRNRIIDNAKLEATKTAIEEVNSWFNEELKPHQKVAVTKAGLKTDLSSLMDKVSTNALKSFLQGSQAREHKINSLLVQIAQDPDLKQYRHFFEKAADDLGYYMVTSTARPDGVPFMNAHNIVMMNDAKNHKRPEGEAFNKAIDLVDQLATLSALRYVKNTDKNNLYNLIDSNWEGMNAVFIRHNQLKERALQELFGGKPALMQKGFTKQILNSRIQYEQGTLADRERFARAGFYMQEPAIARDPNDPVQDPIYMFKSNLGTINDYLSGIASLTRNSAKGTNTCQIQKQIGNTSNTSQAASAADRQVRDALEKKIDAMFSPAPRPPYKRTGRENHMIPKFDVDGNVVEMRYVMSEDTKDAVLEQFSEFDAVLGAMTSQIIDKVNTPKINNELIEALKELHDKEFDEVPGNYVEISPVSSNPELRDIYHMLPQATKNQIKSVWGENKMMVSADVISLAFGQRKYTAIEMFAKDKTNRSKLENVITEVLSFALGFNNPLIDSPLNDKVGDTQRIKRAQRQGRAASRTKRAEEFMTQLTKLAKSNIVIRNISVTHGNYMSNLAYLSSKGVPPHKILSVSREAMNSALAYQNTKAELDLLVSKKDIINQKTTLSQATKDQHLNTLARKIKQLKDELANNPSTKMIEAGLMPQIVDDVDTEKIQSPYTYGLDKGIDTVLSSLPAPLEKTTRVLFMTEDTEGYRILNNAVRMTDYVGRYVLYQHYTEKGMGHKDAISAVTDEFINFDLPTHRMVEYLNSIGILWFPKYQLRILKHIKNLVKDQSFTSLATFMIGSLVGGNNIINSIPGVTKDLFQGISDPFSVMSGSAEQILNVELLNSVTP